MVSILDLSRCRSSMMGRAVKAESMAPASSKLMGLSGGEAHQKGLGGPRTGGNPLKQTTECKGDDAVLSPVRFAAVCALVMQLESSGSDRAAGGRECRRQLPDGQSFLHMHSATVRTRTFTFNARIYYQNTSNVYLSDIGRCQSIPSLVYE